MTAPNHYDVRLLHDDTELVEHVLQDVGGVWADFGQGLIGGCGAVSFKTIGQGFVMPRDGHISSIKIHLRKTGSPTDAVEMRIYAGDEYITSTNTCNGVGEQEFLFDNSLIRLKTLHEFYYFAVYRTGNADEENYWGIEGAIPFEYESPVYTIDYDDEIQHVGYGAAVRFDITYTTFMSANIANDVESVTINIGKNTVDGHMVQGMCDIVIDNKSGLYDKNNDESDFYEILRVGNKMSVEVWYDGIRYPQFKGFIRNIRALPGFTDKLVHITLVDRFYPFSKSQVSIEEQANKTASEIVKAVLVELGLGNNEYDIQGDAAELATVTWNNKNAMEALQDAVSVGQHMHFIDGDGVYRFRINEWFSDNTPDFTYNEADDAVEIVQPEDELQNVKNRVSVKWGSSWETREDTSSQAKYGLQDFNFENELMPDDNNVYAGFIAQHLVDFYKDPAAMMDVKITQKFPDVYAINFEHVIRLVAPSLFLDERFTVYNITRTLRPAGDDELVVKLKKWIQPPEVGNYYDLAPFEGDAWIACNPADVKISQSFKLTHNGQLFYCFLKLKYDLETGVTAQLTVDLYMADSNGLPTGSILASSDAIPVTGTGEETYKFNFSTVPRPTLVTTKRYCIVLSTLKSTGTEALCEGNSSYSFTESENKPMVAQSFSLARSGYLYSAALQVGRQTGGSRDITAYLYMADSNGLPTGAALATSNGATTGFPVNKSVTFTFPTLPKLDAGVVYCIAVGALSLDTNCLYTNFGTNKDIYVDLVFDSVVTSVYQDFIASSSRPLSAISGFVIETSAAYSSDTVAAFARLYTAKSNGRPDEQLQQSGERNIGWRANQMFAFSMSFNISPAINLVQGNRYCIGFHLGAHGNIGSDVLIRLYAQSGNPYTLGQPHRYSGGNWTDFPDRDLVGSIQQQWYTNSWGFGYRNANVITSGVASWYDGASWSVIGGNVYDLALSLVLKEYTNKWQTWGKASDVYADGNPGRFVTSWYTVSGKEFYFKNRILNV
jgi:hypothetical protein